MSFEKEFETFFVPWVVRRRGVPPPPPLQKREQGTEKRCRVLVGGRFPGGELERPKRSIGGLEMSFYSSRDTKLDLFLLIRNGRNKKETKVCWSSLGMLKIFCLLLDVFVPYRR